MDCVTYYLEGVDAPPDFGDVCAADWRGSSMAVGRASDPAPAHRLAMLAQRDYKAKHNGPGYLTFFASAEMLDQIWNQGYSHIGEMYWPDLGLEYGAQVYDHDLRSEYQIREDYGLPCWRFDGWRIVAWEQTTADKPDREMSEAERASMLQAMQDYRETWPGYKLYQPAGQLPFLSMAKAGRKRLYPIMRQITA